MRPLGLALLCGVGAVSALGADTYPRQPALDAIHYRFALELTDASDAIAGEATITLRLVAPAAEAVLDLASAREGRGMTVRAVTVDGAAVAFTHAGERLRVPLPAPAAAGRDVAIAVRYDGTPAAGLRFYTTMHGERAAFSENWPNNARQWLPMIDHPYDKATGELIVTAPAHYQVASNGRLVEEVDLGGGRRRTHWKQSVPIASWLYALALARFDVHHAGEVRGIPLQTWVFPPDRAAGRALFEETSRRALAFFSDRIGPFPYEKLANVQASGFGGGMEHATVIFYGEKGVAAGRGPVVHEIAHQWFGNSVTERDWDDVWLSEGFATYFTLLYSEHFDGRDAFVAGLQRSRATIIGQEARAPDTPVVHRNLSDMSRVLNPFVYQKGGWVLHMLRREVGTDAFWAGIAAYYARYRDRNASSDDFRQVMEQVSGRDLAAFFAQWLHRSGVPTLDGSWRYDAARRVVELTLTQTQPADPFQLVVDVAIVSDAGRRVERVPIEGRSTVVTLASEQPPRELTLDPDTWALVDLPRPRLTLRQ